MESMQMLRLALQHPGRWPSRPHHGKELPWMTQNPKVRVRLVSLQAAEYCRVSLAVLCFMCSPNRDDNHCSRPKQRVSVDHDLAGPGQMESLGRNHSKCNKAVSKNL